MNHKRLEKITATLSELNLSANDNQLEQINELLASGNISYEQACKDVLECSSSGEKYSIQSFVSDSQNQLANDLEMVIVQGALDKIKQRYRNGFSSFDLNTIEADFKHQKILLSDEKKLLLGD